MSDYRVYEPSEVMEGDYLIEERDSIAKIDREGSEYLFTLSSGKVVKYDEGDDVPVL